MHADNDHRIPIGGSAGYELKPGDTHTIRSADASLKLTISFDDETSITTTLSPNQVLRFRKGRIMAVTFVLEEAETTVGHPLRLVEGSPAIQEV